MRGEADGHSMVMSSCAGLRHRLRVSPIWAGPERCCQRGLHEAAPEPPDPDAWRFCGLCVRVSVAWILTMG